MAVNSLFQFRRGTAAQWTSANPTLASGEFGYETDTGKAKIGNGTTAWNSLAYALTGSAGTITSITAGTGLSGGTITSSGTISLSVPVTLANGGTGATTQSGAANAILPTQTSQSGKYLTTDGTNVSWGSVSGYLAPTLGSTVINSGATVTTIAGLTLSSPTITTATHKGTQVFQSAGGAGGTNNFIDVNNSTGAMSVTSGYPLNLTATGDITITPTGGTAKVTTDIVLTATNSMGSVNDYETLNLMGCI